LASAAGRWSGISTHPHPEGWARSFARAVAGTPLNMTFNPTTKAFDL
tara:strand:- start:848 stop:988 length:141 start_codon:yes stop_codon:yes gene_type:complete